MIMPSNPRPLTGQSNKLDQIKPLERTSSAMVRDTLVSWMIANNLGEGDRLPTQAALAKVLQTSTHTVHAAMADLVSRGLIRRRRGEGTVLLRAPGITSEAQPSEPNNTGTPPNSDLPKLQGPIAFILAGMSPGAASIPHDPLRTSWLTLSAIEREMQDRVVNPELILSTSWSPNVDPVAELRKTQAHGAIILWIGEDQKHESAWRSVRHAMLGLNMPVVHVGRMGFEASEVQNLVFPDQVGIGTAAARHLFSLGHKRIMIAHSAANLKFENDRRNGFTGFFVSHTDCGVTISTGGRVGSDGVWEPLGALAFQRWVDIPKRTRPTAVFCVNDGTATGFILAAREAGVRVPEDVSVMGVDNFQGLFYPHGIHLTTLDQNFTELATETLTLLTNLISGAFKHSTITKIEPKLIIRSTTAAYSEPEKISKPQ